MINKLFFSFNQPVEFTFVPSDISGLILWLDASTISGADNDPIASWNDQSAENNDATQSNAGWKPLLKTNQLNSKSVLRFDGTDDEMNITPTTPKTVFVVQKSTGDGCFLGNGTINRQFRIGSGGANELIMYDGSNAPTSSTLSVSRGSWSLLCYVISGTTVSFYENGVAKGTGTLNPIELERIASKSGQLNLNGDIAEIIAYDSALNGTDRANVETYLNSAWSVY